MAHLYPDWYPLKSSHVRNRNTWGLQWQNSEHVTYIYGSFPLLGMILRWFRVSKVEPTVTYRNHGNHGDGPIAMGPSWYTFEGSEATSQSRKSGSQSFVTFASSMNMNLHEFSGICPLYVLRNQKADHVTKFQLQSSVAQRVGTCIVHFCLNSKPRAVHTIEACINQYGSFLKWVYPKSSWVSMRKWFNDWMFWGHPYFRKPPYEWNSWDWFCFNHDHIQIQISLRKWPITVGIIGSLGSACWPKP